MELITRLGCVGVIGLTAAAGACGLTETPPAIPPLSAVELNLQTPRTDDGAVVLTLRGPDVSNLQAASRGYLMYSWPTAPDEMRIIVVGDLKAGPLATLSVGSGHQLSEYSVIVDQVAARTDSLRADHSGYGVSVTVQ
jgi:hypothetical protein